MHVLQAFVEQVVQAAEEVLRRLLPPPIPKEENIFCMSLLPQPEQEILFSFPNETRHSKWFPHFLQMNSYIGIEFSFYIIFTPEKSSVMELTACGQSIKMIIVILIS